MLSSTGRCRQRSRRLRGYGPQACSSKHCDEIGKVKAHREESGGRCRQRSRRLPGHGPVIARKHALLSIATEEGKAKTY